MRRRAMMAADGGITFSLLDKTVLIQIGRTAATYENLVLWSNTVILRSHANSNNVAGQSRSITNFATDGKHFWAHYSGCTNVTYDGNPCEFSRSSSGNYFMVTIPDNYDPTIPIVFT